MSGPHEVLALHFADGRAADVDVKEEWWTTPNALAADALQGLTDGGYSVIPDGHARIDGQVVPLSSGWLYMVDTTRCAVGLPELDGKQLFGLAAENVPKRIGSTVLYVAVPLDSDQAEPTGDARRPKGEADDE